MRHYRVFAFTLLLFISLFLYPLFSVSMNLDDSLKSIDKNSVIYSGHHRRHRSYRHILTRPHSPDSLDMSLHQKKNFWRAGAETVGFNIALWSFDRYVSKGQYAYISWNSIKENFKHGFEWDNDHLNTNMFAHPYSGSLYFNAARSNGYNFWQSELFAIGGSAMWELFMEREYPSTNDIIATPIGGAALGEVLYRTSDLVLDDRTTGAERFGREAAAFIIDPMKGINRIITGAAWKKRATSGKRFGVPPVSVELSLGCRYLSLIDNDTGSKAGASAEINIEYGYRYSESTNIPYDYFSFLMELQYIKTQPLLSRIEAMGRLLSKEIHDTKKANLNIGLYQHFDYFDSDTIRPERKAVYFPCSVPYKLGTPASVGGGLMYRYNPTKIMSLDGYVHLNAVALAGILTDFYRDYHRNYNWGSGFSIKASLNMALWGDKLHLRLANQHYRLYTWKGYNTQFNWSLTPEGSPVDVQGDASHSYFNHFETTVNYKLINRLYLTGGFDFYARKTMYDKMRVKVDNTYVTNPIINSRQFGFHIMCTYKL